MYHSNHPILCPLVNTNLSHRYAANLATCIKVVIACGSICSDERNHQTGVLLTDLLSTSIGVMTAHSQNNRSRNVLEDEVTGEHIMDVYSSSKGDSF